MSKRVEILSEGPNQLLKLPSGNEWQLIIDKTVYSAEQNFLLSTALHQWQRYQGKHLVPVLQVFDDKDAIDIRLGRQGCTPLPVLLKTLAKHQRRV